MISRNKYRDLLWIDVERPSHEEIRTLMEEFDIHPIVADELLTPSLRPKVDHYENFIYLILHFPAIRHSHASTTQEVDFIIGKNFIITVRYELLDPLHKFSKVFEVNSILDKSDIGEHAGYLFFYMIRKIYSSLQHELSIIAENMKDVEDRIFSGEERAMVETLSSIHRDLLAFHRALRLHKPVLSSLGNACEEFFGRDFRHYTDNIVGEFYKVEELLEDQREILGDLRVTNDSLLSAKTNEIMKALTAAAFLMIPATLIAQMFSIPSESTPFVHEGNGFFVVFAFMISAVVMAFLFSRRRNWL
jgi:magnesium transporter